MTMNFILNYSIVTIYIYSYTCFNLLVPDFTLFSIISPVTKSVRSCFLRWSYIMMDKTPQDNYFNILNIIDSSAQISSIYGYITLFLNLKVLLIDW